MGGMDDVEVNLPPGTWLAEKYRVTRTLGQGGMGVVLEAVHVALDTPVAIKIMLPQALADPIAGARFLQEARAAAKLQSEHVARVLDFGTLPSSVTGVPDRVGALPFMVMEMLEGADLAALLDARGPMAVADAVDHVIGAIDAVAEAHALGIVHRDLKPANLFLASRIDGSRILKVLDFGISKALAAAAPSIVTSSSALVGSPAYMSPEQAKGEQQLDARSDIWSFGVVLYELLSGELPFSGVAPGEIFAKILTEEPVPLRARRPDVPESLEGIIRRCMRRPVAARYPNVAELARALAPFGSGKCALSVERAAVLLARTVELDETLPGPTAPPGHGTGVAWSSGSRRRTRSRLATVIAVRVVLGGAVLAYRQLRSAQGRPPRRPSPSSAAPEAAGLRRQAASVAPAPSVTPRVRPAAARRRARRRSAAAAPRAPARAPASSRPAPSRDMFGRH
ncbi:MAG: serine/threonine-protein kinase [Polyangiaceae bacterium]